MKDQGAGNCPLLGANMKLKCIVCGTPVSLKSCWIDDIGWLCKQCGLRLRLERIWKNAKERA